VTHRLRRMTPGGVPSLRRDPVDATTLAESAEIVDAVRRGGVDALRRYGESFGDVEVGETLVATPDDCRRAFDALPEEDRELLSRTARRIRTFAATQRQALSDVRQPIPGGEAGHTVAPVEAAGCYAPGGRFPLPSSVLMTAVTARTAGVETVWVASPKPTPMTLAAAHVAGADALLRIGGAQAIAALAYGAGAVPACDVIVGPGNRWVTAAKQLVAGSVAIDMLAGPSELRSSAATSSIVLPAIAASPPAIMYHAPINGTDSRSEARTASPHQLKPIFPSQSSSTSASSPFLTNSKGLGQLVDELPPLDQRK